LCGIENSFDLFNKNIFNEFNLCKNNHFKKGRALEKIINSVLDIKEIHIEKAIKSLQLMIPKNNDTGYIPVGKSLSEQIGKMLSGVNFDFEGLSIQVREQLQEKNSHLLQKIKNYLTEFENNGVKIIYYSNIEKPINTKKVNKKVTLIGSPTSINMSTDDFVSKLEWEIVPIKDSQMLIVEDKNISNETINFAIENNIKIMTFKQIKLLFL
jgi:hypothetical protein